VPVQIKGVIPPRKPPAADEPLPPVAAPTSKPPARAKRAPLRDSLVDAGIARDRTRRATQALRVREDDDARARLSNDTRRKLEIVEMPIDELLSAKRRGRKTSEAQLVRLRASLRRYGFRLPILIDRDKGIVVGHGLAEAARDIGFETAPVVCQDDLDPKEAEHLALTLNRTGETGEWDIPALKPILEDFVEDGEDLTLAGFDDPFLDTILADETELRPERPLDVPEVVVTRPDDVWALDDHRVGCLNAEHGEAVKKVTGGVPVVAGFFDFPFNVPIKGFVTSKAHKTFVMGAGEMSAEAFQAFLTNMLLAMFAVIVPGGVLFACMDWRSIDLLMAAARAAGYEIVTLAVWSKGAGGQPGGLYRSAHELVLVLRKPGGTMINNVKGGKYRTNVWSYPGGASFGSEARDGLKSHSTPKSPSMVADALADVSRRGDVVADFCVGGGTTLIAAERTGRVFYGGDLDPQYVDITVLRWQRETGRLARLLATGETYAEVAQRRAAETASGAPPNDASATDLPVPSKPFPNS
jgi:DNA modification methylase